MADKVVSISKNDVTQIIEVNKKAIELQSEVSSQNEEVLENLEEISKDIKEIKDDFFKIKVLLTSGIITLILTIIQFIIALKK